MPRKPDILSKKFSVIYFVFNDSRNQFEITGNILFKLYYHSGHGFVEFSWIEL